MAVAAVTPFGVQAHAAAGYADPMSVAHAFYQTMDAGRFDASLRYLPTT
jgi:hypothetical protein